MCFNDSNKIFRLLEVKYLKLIFSVLTMFSGKGQGPSEIQCTNKRRGQCGKFCSVSTVTVLMLENGPADSYTSLIMSRKLTF